MSLSMTIQTHKDGITAAVELGVSMISIKNVSITFVSHQLKDSAQKEIYSILGVGDTLARTKNVIAQL